MYSNLQLAYYTLLYITYISKVHKEVIREARHKAICNVGLYL